MPGRHSKERWRCPARDCQGGNHRLQRALSAGELARIPERDRVLIEENRAGAFRCRHCGCVYLHESHLDLLIGFLDGAAAGKGWHPVFHAR
jgi:hypothetical protein